MRPEKDTIKYLAARHGARFHQFARNGRWGTCADCPQDNDHVYYPEFCPNTERYDHWLTLDAMVEAYKRDKERHEFCGE